MGNVINKDNDTINWNNVKTDNFTSNNQNAFLSDDSKLLISKLQLNLPDVVASESDGFSDVEKIFNKYQIAPQNTKSASELSDTSPFISSEMYNYLMTKNNINQQDGGAWGKKGKQHGGAIEEDSSTSSTSSSGDSPRAKPKGKGKKESSSDSDSGTMSGGSDNLSYISSSAHTNSDSYESEDSGNNTTQSGGDSVPNENGEVPPSSINTSDINMISESS